MINPSDVEDTPLAAGVQSAMPHGARQTHVPAYGIEDPYDVLLVGLDGSAGVFESYQ